MKKTMTLVLLCLLGTLSAVAQTDNTFKDRLTLKGYGQLRYDAVRYNNGTAHNSFDISRFELIAAGRITKHWGMGATVQFNKPVLLKDLYITYIVAPELAIRVGQFKTPLGMENNTAPFLNNLSSGGTYVTNYFVGTGGNEHYFGTAGRDMGVELSGSFFKNVLSYRLMGLNGRGMNRRASINPKLVAASLTVRPTKGLRLMGSGMIGEIESMSPAVDKPLNIKMARATAGLELTSRPVTVMTEVLYGRDAKRDGMGAYLTAANHFKRDIDLVLGADYTRPDVKADASFTSATIGLQQWFYGKCRWQLEYQYRLPQGGSKLYGITEQGHCLAAQLQFVF